MKQATTWGSICEMCPCAAKPICPPPVICPPRICPPPVICPPQICPPCPPRICPPPVICPPQICPPCPPQICPPCPKPQPPPPPPPPPVLPSLPPTSFKPMITCCRTCICYIRRKRDSLNDYDRIHDINPVCNNDQLMMIMKKKIRTNVTESTIAIKKAADSMLQAEFNVFCAINDLTHVAHAEHFCQYKKDNNLINLSIKNRFKKQNNKVFVKGHRIKFEKSVKKNKTIKYLLKVIVSSLKNRLKKQNNKRTSSIICSSLYRAHKYIGNEEMNRSTKTKISFTRINKKWRLGHTGKKYNKVRFSRNIAKKFIGVCNIIRLKKSVSRSVRPFENQKSTSFNVFQLLVPKEKVEIVVDDTQAEEMNSETAQEVQLFNVRKSNADSKTDGEKDTADLDVILLTNEECSSSRQENLNKDEPEIVILDDSAPSKSDLNTSDEIICLQDLKMVNEVPTFSVTPKQKTVKELPRETRTYGTRRGRQSRAYCEDLRKFPSIRNPVSSSSSSIHAKNMPEFVDLLTQGTLLICKKWLRRWDIVQSGVIGGNPLRICSYNVLCQQTAYKTPELYIHLTKPGRAYELTWENRWRLLTREFSMIGADIFCLQEVQYDHYDQFFRPYFEAAGFFGKYKKRTNNLLDGCAIFYKSHLQLLHYRYIEYFLNIDSVLNRDNVGQLIRLKDMRSGREFCVVNTHLLFNKRRGDVKLAQLAILLANIDQECGPESGQECPYILCGDFNFHPYSPIYNFIMNGEICFTNLRRGDISGQGNAGGPFVSVNLLPEDVKIARNCRFNYLKNRTMLLPSLNCWSHPLCFNSVYQNMNGETRPMISTYHSIEAVNPDFIFYSVKSKRVQQSMLPHSVPAMNVSEREIRLIRRLSLPDMNELAGTLGPWPNSTTPSDHIPLIADFVLQ
ncbi:Protein angel [Dirofilaria immitis]